uniref:Uncharacterized protein n=1 Tax=Panagrolaimus sp. JU765 TaxID=591449 RepID=A0AC34QTQ4_9BILA
MIPDKSQFAANFRLNYDGSSVLNQLFIVPNEEPSSSKQKLPEPPIEPDPGSVIWQLFGHCSKGFLQFDQTVNARGSSFSCNSNFLVRVQGAGSVVLRHALTKKYICFNRRKRITMRVDPNDIKCHFTEKIDSAGYTLLESTWWPKLHLGFNHKGRFQDPSQFKKKYRCFLFTKLEHFASTKELNKCSKRPKTGHIRRHRDQQGASSSILKMPDSDKFAMDWSLLNHARNSLLKTVEI